MGCQVRRTLTFVSISQRQTSHLIVRSFWLTLCDKRRFCSNQLGSSNHKIGRDGCKLICIRFSKKSCACDLTSSSATHLHVLVSYSEQSVVSRPCASIINYALSTMVLQSDNTVQFLFFQFAFFDPDTY